MIILDTHAWIWFVTESPYLSHNALSSIKDNDICGICAISCWEVAMLVEKKRIGFSFPIDEWINLALSNVLLLPLSPEISIKAARLGNTFHGDPADRIITATAILNGCPLITKDERIQNSGLLSTIW